MRAVTTKKSVFIKLIAFVLALNFYCSPLAAQNQNWMVTGNLSAARFHHTATLLANGKVLVIGGFGRCSFPAGCTELASAELYDPATGAWSATGGLSTMQGPHLAVRLLNGKVLAVGSSRTNPALSSAELYDPETGTWTVTGSPRVNRMLPVAVLLSSGKVLLTGGAVATGGGFTVLNTAELYDPATGTWSTTGNLSVARVFHSATLLGSSQVLVAGGNSNLDTRATLRSAEVYDPLSGTWSVTGDLVAGRAVHTATLLLNGKVLVSTGIANGTTALNSAELYDPVAGTWSATGSLNTYRQTATLLPGGKVLATGGDSSSNTTEIYDPATGTWGAAANLRARRGNHTVTLLTNNKVLAAAGTTNGEDGLNSAELYDASTLVGALSTVSAASYRAEVASNSIAAAFGANLANATVTASFPLLSTLAGAVVKVKDSAGVERDARLFFVSPGQVNFAVPEDTADGTATVTVINNGITAASGTVQVANVAPGLFGMSGNGQGVAAAVLLRVKPDGTQVFEAVATFDAAQNRFVAAPIDLGPETDQLFLLLFGTGLRGRSRPAAVSVTLGGVMAEVTYSGQQGQLIGLDQVNVRLPRSLAGRGEVNIVYTTDGKAANVVTVSVR